MKDQQIDTDRIDEVVLGLFFLSLHDEPGFPSMARAWKSFDWNALARLHAKGLILNPVGKAKSIVLTPEGVKECEAAFHRLFVRKDASREPPAD